MSSPASLDPSAASGGSSASPPARPRPSWRRFFVFAGLSFVGLLLLLGVGFAGAEYWTSRPTFCGSCHVMDPYYESYTHDIHGRKIGALCVDCHYAPGERLTFRAKFKGLSQAASYFSGRYGAGRPRAHVANESCLRSACHGDGAYLNKTIVLGEARTEKRMVAGQEVEVQRTPTVNFYHNKHLEIDDQLSGNARELEEVRQRLRGELSEQDFPRVEAAAISVTPADERGTALDQLLAAMSPSDAIRADAAKLADLEHRKTRLEQLSGLHCTGCHGFDPTRTNHIAVDRAACYTCHFTNEAFNKGTGECLRCHSAPSRSIMIHASPVAGVAAPVLMDHNDIITRGVNCESCHFDVVRGDTRVSERDCAHCHDQAQFLEGFAVRTAETVRQYHEVHIHGQKARCTDCHRAVEHGLLNPQQMAGSAEILQPVRNDCQHCHPNHHSEQIALLTGTGGMGLAHETPNAMMGSRLNCRACHTQSATDLKGDALIKATEQGCVACHGDDYVKLFEQWKSELDTYLSEAEQKLQSVTLEVDAARADADVAPEVEKLLADARENVRLVSSGGGLHNRHYALQLLDTARGMLDQVSQKLAPIPQ